MTIDQRHVTTINLHDGKVRDFVLTPDDHGYKLTCVSKDEVVSLLLSFHDFQKLRHQLAKFEWREGKNGSYSAPEQSEGVGAAVTRAEWKEGRNGHRAAQEKREVVTVTSPFAGYEWTTVDWLAYN